MALKLRKGLEADRLDITPAEAEPIYVTDTKKVFIGDGITPGGNALVSTESGIKHPFTWGNVESILIATLEIGTTVRAIYFIVYEAFDGVGATITVGTTEDPDLFISASDVDLKTVGTYLISPGYKCVAPVDVKIFNTAGSGASTGMGTVIINF